jgi:glycosyltransferase involved in cell wall biosynthesis
VCAATDAPEAPVKVAVCVATYRRPEGLKALIASLNALEAPYEALVSVILVDNDAAAPIGPPPSRWPLTYLVEAERGLSAARNRALDATPPETDFVAFVDDDERVSPGWLRAMLATQRRTGAEAVQGPVEPEYGAPAPRWIVESDLFRMGPFAEGAPIGYAATNNSLVSWRFVAAHGLRFDPAFSRSGGEDHDFFHRLQALGGRIVTSAEAVVVDTVPASRLALSALFWRQFRKGNTLGRVALKHRTGAGRELRLGLTRALRGGAGALRRFALGDTAGPSVTRAAYGLGALAAFIGLRYDAYADRRISRDRAGASRP